MNRIIVSFERDTTRLKICGLLERNGYGVRASYRAGAETIRAIHKMGGGIIICGYKLIDMTVNDLYANLDGSALIMAIAPAGDLQMSEIPDIVRVNTPLSRSDFFEAFNAIWAQEEDRLRREIPQRSEVDQALLHQAKDLLMAQHHMTEPQAHAWIQKKSMQARCKMVDTANRIIAHYSA